MLHDKSSAVSCGKEHKIPHGQLKLGSLVIEALTILLTGNSPNANVLRECGGAKCVHKSVQFPECRSHALGKCILNYFSFTIRISSSEQYEIFACRYEGQFITVLIIIYSNFDKIIYYSVLKRLFLCMYL